MTGKLNSTEIEQILTKEIIGRIGCHADGVTYIVPISYAYDGKCVYAHSYEGFKIDLMRKNPNVCFEVDTMENMANWKSVIAWGVFKELTDASERKAGIEKLLGRQISGAASKTVQLSPQWPFSSKGDLDNMTGIILCISLDKKTGRFEKSDEVIF
ncbi:MAG TPA: pyridoxamine 5'-phosphate oxidase family protein [Ginsengibacter sp.]|nr:pyridoxamine 5'-phosphate oxidase family protein [Ginsengibacter sp.]